MEEYRRKLPHIQPDDAYLFVTWRLHGSLPAPEPEVVYATPGQAFAAEDRLLARAPGPQWLSDSRVANCVANALLAGEIKKAYYELNAWVVMPNHVHILIRPNVSLRRITHWLKGSTAKEANRLLGRAKEAFWQHESHDHWVRNRREFDRIVAYIEWRWSSAGWAS